MVRWLLVTIGLTLAAPTGAQAATVTVSGGVLRYAATPGTVTHLTLTESNGDVVLTREAHDDDPLEPGAGCTGSPLVLRCSGAQRAVIDAGDESDRITATPVVSGSPVALPLALTVKGGTGHDVLIGGRLDDTLDGGPGDDSLDGSPGQDALGGGDGNDLLEPDVGTDAVSGGDGIDTVRYGLRAAPSYTLDGLANDGGAGENDLIGVDVENVDGAASSGTATLAGDGHANHLKVAAGRGAITGGEGADVLEGGPLDDVIHARDSSPDRVICAAGSDTVVADTLDLIAPGCEQVSVQATPGGPFDDRPPVLAWAAPAAGASLAANGATMLRVDASDDRGVAKVQFFDDERLLCEDAAAPYECAYRPRGGDVGRNTLLAVAVDGANQTTGLVRAVTVRRFAPPALSFSLRPGRDRRAPYSFRATGTLHRPGFVAPSLACAGRVTITAKRGARTVARFRAPLSRTCRFARTIRFRGHVASRVRVLARFGGNAVLAPRSAPSRTARLG